MTNLIIIIMSDIPISTKWTLDAAGETGRIAIDSVFMVLGNANGSKGTGFAYNGKIITNEHVVRDNLAKDIILTSTNNEKISVSDIIVDTARDLAILTPTSEIKFNLKLSENSNIELGNMVLTWGFPLGFDGPAPLLSVGFLAGFTEEKSNRRLVVNGAFNPGNSGGPLFLSGSNEVIGVVVSKHAPISKFHLSALDVLAKNRTGVTYTGTDSEGQPTKFVESEIVADLLNGFRSLTQVMIGKAISIEVLKEFLQEHALLKD